MQNEPYKTNGLEPEIVGKVFSAEECEADDKILATAKSVFKIPYLMPWQRLVIGNILDAAEIRSDLPENLGEDANDVFCLGRQIVLLPTGAGKSLCFLLPAVIFEKPTLVFYPLLALMSDQARRMSEQGIECVAFRGGQSNDEREENFRRIKNGAKVILANPEVLQNRSLLARIKECGIAHIAIDEAHCVAEWGDTFRPAYLTLGEIIKFLDAPLVTAFTATASPPILDRIAEVLFEKRAHLVRGESDRPNIRYNVEYAWSKKKAVCRLAQSEERPMIVFCGTRSKAKDMAQELAECVGRENVRFYHAGLTNAEKTKIEKWFFPKKDAILCCTCAFGMGVDKSDVRTVIHLEPSPSVESYVQEAGRGGRDKKPAKAILLWSYNDSLAAEKTPADSRARLIKKFAESAGCRRQVLLDALDGENAVCSGCDICDGKSRDKNFKAPTVFDAADARRTFELIRGSNNYYSKQAAAEAVKKELNERDKKFFGFNIWEQSDIEAIISQLEKCGAVRKKNFLWSNALCAAINENAFSEGRQKRNFVFEKIAEVANRMKLNPKGRRLLRLERLVRRRLLSRARGLPRFGRRAAFLGKPPFSYILRQKKQSSGKEE